MHIKAVERKVQELVKASTEDEEMEMAMKAFCKVVYVERGLDHRSLVHGHGPVGDPQIQSSAFDPLSVPRLLAPPSSEQGDSRAPSRG